MLRIHVETKVIIKQINKLTAEVFIKLNQADAWREFILKNLGYIDLVFIPQEQQQSQKNPKTQFATSPAVIFH